MRVSPPVFVDLGKLKRIKGQNKEVDAEDWTEIKRGRARDKNERKDLYIQGERSY